MGLAVLPARLKQEMALLKEYILTGKDIAKNEDLAKHAEWVAEFLPHYTSITEETIDQILEQEIGKVFVQVLEDAGVYKWDGKKVMLPSYVLYRLCNFGNFSTCQAEGFPLI